MHEVFKMIKVYTERKTPITERNKGIEMHLRELLKLGKKVTFDKTRTLVILSKSVA